MTKTLAMLRQFAKMRNAIMGMHTLISMPMPLILMIMTINIGLAFSPLIALTADAGNEILEGAVYNKISSDNYKFWLVIEAACAGPMLVEFILDLLFYHKEVAFTEYLSRALILIALIVPSLVMYLYTVYGSSETPAVFFLLLFALTLSKQMLFITGIFMSMFSHKMESIKNSSIKLPISLPWWTMVCLFLWMVQRIFIVCTVSVPDDNIAIVLDRFRVILSVSSIVATLYICWQIIYFLSKQQVSFGQFQCYEHFSAFHNTMVLTIFVISEVAIQFEVSNSSSQRRFLSGREDAFQRFVAISAIQIALTIALTIIPGRSYHLLAKLREEKLNTRLNLIRYVSHEMRTPLNTSCLGLEMLKEDLKGLHNLNDVHTKRNIDLEQPVINESVLNNLDFAVQQVQDSCNVAVQTLNDLLTFDKLDENRLWNWLK